MKGYGNMKQNLWTIILTTLVPAALVMAQGPKVSLKVKKGDTASFTSKTISAGSRGETKIEIEYRIEAAGAKDGDLELQVSFESLKIEETDPPFTYDSSKAGDGEGSKVLKEATAKPITVKIESNKVSSITGLPPSIPKKSTGRESADVTRAMIILRRLQDEPGPGTGPGGRE
jgi:hypothetical protein